MVDKGHIRCKIDQLADRQHGFVTRAQLLELGVSRRMITRHVAKRHLIPIHAGVYGVGHAERAPVARAHAAVLACGRDAVLSHDSAAALWGLRSWPEQPEVTVPAKKNRPGVRAHRSATLTASDIATHHGIAITSPIRTVIDVNPRLTDRQLIRAINDARLSGYLGRSDLRELLRRCPRAQRLIDPAQKPTRSTLEDDFMRWITRHRLPVPRINSRLTAGRSMPSLQPST